MSRKKHTQKIRRKKELIFTFQGQSACLFGLGFGPEQVFFIKFEIFEKKPDKVAALKEKLDKYVQEKTDRENAKAAKKAKASRTYEHIPRKPEIGMKISPTNPPELQTKIDEALAKKPKTLDPLIVSEHALKRSSTVNIASSIMQALDVRNTKIYPERRLVSHVSSCSCKSKTMKVWDFDEILEGSPS